VECNSKRIILRGDEMVVSFKELTEIEPRLGELLNQIKAEHIVTNWRECWVHRWYGISGEK
jgi:hypothetical protein